MTYLIVTPLQEELNLLTQNMQTYGFVTQDQMIGRIVARHVPALNLIMACGGLGKTQFGIQTQHLLDFSRDTTAVICAGAAGALADYLKPGDLVVATTTVEHDCIYKFVKRPLPRFLGTDQLIEQLQQIPPYDYPFTVHYGTIASGDEDIVDRSRAEEIFARTGAIAVAWEGAGGARACAFSNVPFVEIRGLTDAADHDAPTDFDTNLALVMHNIALLVVQWLRRVES